MAADPHQLAKFIKLAASLRPLLHSFQLLYAALLRIPPSYIRHSFDTFRILSLFFNIQDFSPPHPTPYIQDFSNIQDFSGFSGFFRIFQYSAFFQHSGFSGFFRIFQYSAFFQHSGFSGFSGFFRIFRDFSKIQDFFRIFQFFGFFRISRIFQDSWNDPG